MGREEGAGRRVHGVDEVWQLEEKMVMGGGSSGSQEKGKATRVGGGRRRGGIRGQQMW